MKHQSRALAPQTRAFDPASLFTPRQRIPMPGQDPQRVEELFHQLCCHFEPKDPIEAMWVSDIASITARIEHLRRCHRAATLVSLRREAADNPRFRGDIDYDESIEVRCEIYEDQYKLGTRPGEYESEENLPVVRLLGAVSMGSLAREEDFMGLEFAALRERDRIIAQMERRRREAMVLALKTIDQEDWDDRGAE